jgi:hypothetical protein
VQLLANLFDPSRVPVGQARDIPAVFFAPRPFAVALFSVRATVGGLSLRELEQLGEFVVRSGQGIVVADQRLGWRMRLRAIEAGGMRAGHRKQAERGYGVSVELHRNVNG